MNTCPICGKDVLIEDLYECDKCHKQVCPDCIINNTREIDNSIQLCKNCISPDPFEEGR